MKKEDDLLMQDAVARKAVANAKKALPRWQSMARILTRRPNLQVKLSGYQSSTDGDTIWIKVPYELGEDLTHDRQLCGKRLPNKMQACPACWLLESIDTHIIHECSHQIFETFLKMDERDAKDAIRHFVAREVSRNPGSPRTKKLQDSLEQAVKTHGDYYRVAATVHEFVSLLMNIMEDARVNAAVQQARPGTVDMFSALYNQMLECGTKTLDGNIQFFSDSGKNFQMAMGFLLHVSNMDYAPFFDDQIIEDLKDEKLNEIAEYLREAGSVRDSYFQVLPLLDRLNELGYFLVPDEDSDDSDDDSNDDSGEVSDAGDSNPADDSEAESGEPGPDDGQPAPYTQADLERDGTPEEVMKLIKIATGHGDEVDDLEATADVPGRGGLSSKEMEKIVERAVNQMDFFDSPSLMVSGVKVVRHESGEMGWEKDPYYESYSSEIITIPETILAPALNRLRLVFTENMKRRHEHNLKSGKVDSRTLGKRAGLGDPRIFKKRILPGKRDYFVVIGCDVSGSTGSGAIRVIKEAVMAKAELLNRLNVPFVVYAHSGDHGGGGARVAIMEVKSRKEPWGDVQRKALSELRPYAGNLDGHTLEFYRKRAQESQATDRLILYYTDGEMPAANYNEELEVLQREIKVCAKLGIDLVGVGIGTDSPAEHGLDTIVLNTVDDVPLVVAELQKRLGGG